VYSCSLKVWSVIQTLEKVVRRRVICYKTDISARYFPFASTVINEGRRRGIQTPECTVALEEKPKNDLSFFKTRRQRLSCWHGTASIMGYEAPDCSRMSCDGMVPIGCWIASSVGCSLAGRAIDGRNRGREDRHSAIGRCSALAYVGSSGITG